MLHDKELTLTDYWRSIVLRGRNVASYKFAIAKTLLDLQPQSGQLITLEELALPFAKHIASHLQHTDKQATSSSSKFLDQCRSFNASEITEQELQAQTVRLGFNNVIDAFHVVGNEPIAEAFYVDARKTESGIIITDSFSALQDVVSSHDLSNETEARWRLVETSWSLGINRGLLGIAPDESGNELQGITDKHKRISVTSSRDALNGYQKGSCFYCGTKISLTEDALKPDVDHFIPHTMKPILGNAVDGVWNLVLSCTECNRGTDGKFDRLPALPYAELLHLRNESLIGSHHPLRETLINQLGNTTEKRLRKFQNHYDTAKQHLIHTWSHKSR